MILPSKPTDLGFMSDKKEAHTEKSLRMGRITQQETIM
jgi:hypothetical protein